MQRVTITLDDELMAELDAIIEARGYQNRSEAIRDLARGGIREAAATTERARDCVAALVYVYDHAARQLAKRLTSAYHDHHELSLASLHVHLDHDTCLEVTVLRGTSDDVQHFGEHVIAERGVRHGKLVRMPTEAPGAKGKIAQMHHHGHGHHHDAGRARLMRRARGYAPAPIKLPHGFEVAPELLACGGELKATFCLVKDGEAILSQHQGDLEDALTFDDYRKNLSLYRTLFDHEAEALVADRHPEYLSTKLAHERARDDGLPLIEVQHHHAHVAACLAENGRALDAPPVLGIVLDGLGFGDDRTIWGGEFLLADYRRYERLGTFKPVAMPGGASAVREPWRNLYAHLMAEMGWAEFALNFSELELFSYLEAKPRATFDTMIKNGVNAPLASSCGRLFDAVSSALGLVRERQAYEGEAAARLEAIVDEDALHNEDELLAYPLNIPNLRGSGLPYIEPLAMWQAILGDLILKTPAPVMAARFHKGLAKAIAAMTRKLSRRDDPQGARFDTVALSGGCFQNRILFEEVTRRLEADEFTVLTHALVPANDGGLALGQAAIGAAQLIDAKNKSREGNAPCVSESLAEL
jgi:hydrogenase maturation protein HypF